MRGLFSFTYTTLGLAFGRERLDNAAAHTGRLHAELKGAAMLRHFPPHSWSPQTGEFAATHPPDLALELATF